MSRKNPFVRVRRYDQRPVPLYSWFINDGENSYFADSSNPTFDRDKRMQSWRRPL